MSTEAQKEAEKIKTQEIRDSIKVTHNMKDDDGNPLEAKPEEKEEPEVKEEDKEEVEVEAEKEDKEEAEVEAATETEEDQPENDKIKRIKDKSEKRIQKEVQKRKDLERALAAANAKLEAEGKGDVLTSDDVEKLANQKVNQKLLEKQQEEFDRRFANDCNKLFDEAVKIDKNFKPKVDSLAEEIGRIPQVLIGALADLDNGGAVLNYLTDNTEEAEKIFELSNNNLVKLGSELAKLSTKVKPKAKQISKVSDPPSKQLGGNSPRSGNGPPPDPNKNMKAYVEWRNRDIAEKRAAGRVNLR